MPVMSCKFVWRKKGVGNVNISFSFHLVIMMCLVSSVDQNIRLAYISQDQEFEFCRVFDIFLNDFSPIKL